MPAYALFEVTINADADEAAQRDYERYRAAVPAIIEQYGGRYLARAWAGFDVDGGPAGDRFHLIEFPDADRARAFWASPEYAAISHLRHGSASVRAVVLHPQ